MFCSPFYF